MEQKDKITVVSLNDASSIGRTISNKTSQSIIEFVKENKGCTASEVAKVLEIPASTVHYNISALLKAKILDDSEFHYSTKGKEVIHYSVTDQIIVIVPNKDNSTITSKLKQLLPGILASVVVGVIFVSTKLISNISRSPATLMETSPDVILKSSKLAGDSLSQESAVTASSSFANNMTAQSSAHIINATPFFSLHVAYGILIGLTLATLACTTCMLIKKYRQKRKVSSKKTTSSRTK